MTKIWRQSQAEEVRTEAFIADSDWVADFDHALGVSRWRAGDSSSPATVEIESEHPPDDYFDALDMFVVSDRLKTVLENFDVHAEYLPIRVIYMGNEYKDEAFYCCNILDAVECFDFERGECTFHQAAGFTDHIDKIKKLAIPDRNFNRH